MICTNIPGSFKCGCKEGYTGDGYTNCEEKGSCKGHTCGDHGNCIKNTEPTVDNPGQFTCECHDGFFDENYHKSGPCEDIDECSDGSHECGGQAACANNPGSYECRCEDGYELRGSDCKDINECSEDTHNCHVR